MILDEIAKKTKERIEEKKKVVSMDELKAQALTMRTDTGFPFEQALKKSGMSFICEVKKASPSKGLIAKEFPYITIAKDYEEAGADAISCLTEPFYFQGSDQYLQEIAAEVNIPVLRKDFTVDPYMIYEAKVLGASAILLICAILSKEQLKDYYELANSLGLSVLIEAHTEQEVKQALSCGGRIIGVNNRDLKTFQVDIATSKRLRGLVPKEYIYVSESGIRGPEDIRELYENGTDAVLIGELLMRSANKQDCLRELKGV